MLFEKAFTDQPKQYVSSMKIYIFRTIHTQISHAFSVKQIEQIKYVYRMLTAAIEVWYRIANVTTTGFLKNAIHLSEQCLL